MESQIMWQMITVLLSSASIIITMIALYSKNQRDVRKILATKISRADLRALRDDDSLKMDERFESIRHELVLLRTEMKEDTNRALSRLDGHGTKIEVAREKSVRVEAMMEGHFKTFKEFKDQQWQERKDLWAAINALRRKSGELVEE